MDPGTRVGAYEVVAKLGEGGMGEVYRAHDTRLKRDVAIKILPVELSGDHDYLARFEREAQILASLSHPNIAVIHGFEDFEGGRALVMELVEGPTLSDRLHAGPIGYDEMRSLALQLARALEAAHGRGIVHRDLKPSNLKLAEDGTLKVLDFGLAKTLDRGLASKGDSLIGTRSTILDNTAAGTVLGTPAFMAPEQARGLPVDQRADIWAYGCIVFEMITGSRAFAGHSATDVLARVIERDPDWSRLPATTPPGVRRALMRCLTKDPARRLHHIADARIELEDPGGAQPEPPAASSPAARIAPWAVAAALAAIALWALAGRGAPPAAVTPLHLHLQTPPEVEALPALASGFAVSPDGRTVAQIGVREGVRALFAWDLTRGVMHEITAANPATAVAFSPDGGRIAYLSANNHVGVYSLGGGDARVLASDVDLVVGLAWCDQGIVFPRAGTLWLIAPEGGEARRLTALDAARGEIAHGAPVCVPGRDVLLYSSLTGDRGDERIEAAGFGGGRPTVVLERATAAAWSPTGHLIFMREGVVMATAFDPAARRAEPKPTEVLPAGAVAASVFGSAGLVVSATGTMVYVPGDFAFRRLVTVQRDGSAAVMDIRPGRYFNPRVSPDGRRVSVDEDQAIVALLDLARGTKTTLGSPAPGTNYPAWNVDGTRMMFRRYNRPHWMPVDGRGDATALADTSFGDFPVSAGPDPDSMLIVRIAAKTGGDIFQVSMSGAYPPRPILQTKGFDGGPQLSPDGRWLLHQSSESGQPEVYVGRWPALEQRWQISSGGGLQPRWNRNGREVFFRRGSRMFAVSVGAAGRDPVFGRPTVIFDQVYDYGQGVSSPDYDVLPDGRFVMIRPEPGANRLHVTLNWTEALRRQLGAR